MHSLLHIQPSQPQFAMDTVAPTKQQQEEMDRQLAQILSDFDAETSQEQAIIPVGTVCDHDDDDCAPPKAAKFHDGLTDCCGDLKSAGSFCFALNCPCFSYASTVSAIRASRLSWLASLAIFMSLVLLGQDVAINEIKAIKPGMSIQAADQRALAFLRSSQSYLVLFVVAVVLVKLLRSKFRSKFQISGSECSDWCCSLWCQPCVLSQMDRHLAQYQRLGSCIKFGDPGPLSLATREDSMMEHGGLVAMTIV